MTTALNGVTALSHLGVIAVEGDDAAGFLQGQLTQDVALMGPDEARLAAYCTPKGRMQASFVVFKPEPTRILLVISRDILASTLKRLSMYVLRAKAKLRDASSEFDLWGLAGSAAHDASSHALPPAEGQPRQLRVTSAGAARPEGLSLDLQLWQWGEVRSGVATITAPIVEAFVPQMLNYESVGGVNFKKGCYPGQEVVARSQFRGTLKRRAYLAHSSETLSAGQELFHESDAGQPCGLVAQAAPSPGGGFDAIVSVTVASASGGKITSGSAQGADVKVSPPPYSLLDDI